MRKQNENFEGIPGVESEKIQGSQKISLLLSILTSLILFGLLPLSESIRSEKWEVRKVDVNPFTPPPLPKTQMEKTVEELAARKMPELKIDEPIVKLDTRSVNVSLDVGPGDFKAAFSLAGFNPIPEGFGKDLVFDLHDLDRNPSVLKRGRLRYPSNLKRLGLEGEVRLLIQIDEKGRVNVLEVVSSTHPDFVGPSREAAENSVYEPPRRNGEVVKVQFYLPVRFTLLK
ncbi:MAG: TonB family protein [Verrucomicrobiota bacterium]|nr:TonB family protein [Verrucomicrobiota bacterium]